MKHTAMKKIGIILLGIVLFATGTYLFVRYALLRAKDFKPDLSKARSALDLRPALIAKLQQMMKDGTAGLYQLTIDDIVIDPSVSNTQLKLLGVRIFIDSISLQQQDRLHTAPNNVYEVRFRELELTGLGIADLVHRRHIDLDSILIHEPEMHITHTERVYNKPTEDEKDSLSLYERLTKHISHLRIHAIRIDHGVFVSKNLAKRNEDARFDNLSINMLDLLLDSSTRHDRSRFFYTANTYISCGRLQRRTSDGLYLFRIDSLYLDSRAHQLTAWNVSLLPRYSKEIFQQRLRYRTDRFDIHTPKLVLHQMHWWRLFEHGSIDAGLLDIEGGHFYDYVNDTKPSDPVIHTKNFPYQILRSLSLPMNIRKARLHHFNLAYTEFYSPSGESGTIYFDGINATITNLINKPAYIKPGMWCEVNATAMLMHQVPVQVRFGFDMNRYSTGNYRASIAMGKADATVFNPVTRPLGFFLVKRGEIDSFSAGLQGNNAQNTASIRLFYHDLHLTLLEKHKLDRDKTEKRSLVGFIANLLAIKNNNSSEKDNARLPVVTVDRAHSNSFFNFNWRAIRLGTMKAVGVPEKFIPK